MTKLLPLFKYYEEAEQYVMGTLGGRVQEFTPKSRLDLADFINSVFGNNHDWFPDITDEVGPENGWMDEDGFWNLFDFMTGEEN